MEEKKKILVIDDEVMLLEAIEEVFDHLNCDIYKASNGEEALEYLSNQSMDLIVCDISMPGLDGIDILETIRTIGNQAPFIFYTAYATANMASIAEKYDIRKIVEKPNFEKLDREVTKIIMREE